MSILRNGSGRTPRQQEAYDLWVLDYPTDEIARIMGISRRRVWALINHEKNYANNSTEKIKKYRADYQRRKRAEQKASRLLVETTITPVDPPETPRQQEAYDLWQLDLPTQEIANRMGLKSKRSVWSLLHHIKRRDYFGIGKKNRANNLTHNNTTVTET